MSADRAGAGEWEQGQVTITRTTSTERADYITVYVHVNGEQIQAEMELTEFAMAVTGMSRVPAAIRRRTRG